MLSCAVSAAKHLYFVEVERFLARYGLLHNCEDKVASFVSILVPILSLSLAGRLALLELPKEYFFSVQESAHRHLREELC